jgi:hypothetical protein
MADDTSFSAGEATRRAGDPLHLLRGEENAVSGDAFHWVSVYRELVSFKAGLLEQASADSAPLSSTALREVVADVGLLTQQAERYEERLRYWRGMVAVTDRNS